MATKNDQEPAGKPETKPQADASPSAASPAAPAQPRVAAVTKTPAAWAAELGHTKERDRRLPQSLNHVDPGFAVADRLYGWSERAYNFQAPEDAFKITEATYRAAVRNAPQFPAVELIVDALTPEQALALQAHKPVRNLKVERAGAAAKAEAEAATEAGEDAKGNG